MSSHTPACDDDGCYCPDDVFWGRLLGDADPCAPGKDWAADAFDCCCESSPPEFGGNLPDRDCFLHGGAR